MKKHYHGIEDEAVSIPEGFFGINRDFENQQFHVFVTDVDSLQVKLVNKKIKNLIAPHSEEKDDGDYLKKIVHPDQYNTFIKHLKSCKNLSAGQEKELKVFLKTSGEWKEFLFLNRVYAVQGKSSTTSVISIAKEITSQHLFNPSPEILNAQSAKTDKYQLILGSLNTGFCIIDMLYNVQGRPKDYLFIETNPAFNNHVKTSQVEGKTILEIAGEHEAYWFDIYDEVARSGKAKEFENYAENLDHTWFDVYAFPVGDDENRKVVVMFSDITKRKTFEKKLEQNNGLLEQKVKKRTKELKENSELLQVVFDTTNEGIVVLKPIYGKSREIIDFEYLRVNQVIKDQYNKPDLVGKRFKEINPDDTEFGVFDALERTLLTGKPEDFEVFYDKENYNNWFRVTTRLQNNVLITTLEDITQRKFETRRLKETIRFKRQLATTSPDIIMIFNLYEENVRYINRDMAPQRGMRRKEITGMNLLDILPFIHPWERERALQFHENIVKAGDQDILDIEFRLRGKTNHWEWHSARGKVFMRNKKNNVFEYIVLLRNIQQQKETQKALLHAEKLSIKGEVARTLAHELRNPLASIGMVADILSKKATEVNKNELENYTKIIKRSTKTLNNLVTELLSDTNYSAITLKKNCLAEIIDETLKLASDRIYLLGIKVIKQYNYPCYINADREKLKIALLNLIVNASEAMDPDEGVLTLNIEKLKETYVLTIADNGCGLEKEDLNKLFDAYYTRKTNGMGIGLSSVKNILEEHDAKINVNSQLEVGTTFCLTFQSYQLENA